MVLTRSMYSFTRLNDPPISRFTDNHGDVTFSSVPNELKLLFADKLPLLDTNTLGRTSSAMNALLTGYLYRRGLFEPSRRGIPFFYCTLEDCCLEAARIFVQVGADVNMRVLGTRTGRLCCDDEPDEYRDQEINESSGTFIHGHSPLQVAIRSESRGQDDHEKIARLLLDAGADISGCCRSFLSLLQISVWDGYAQIAKLLLDRGSDPNIIDQEGRTLLHLAAIRGYPALVELLFAEGLDVEASDRFGWTALHWAAVNCDRDTVKALLDSHANVQATDPFGNTPLLVAVHYRGMYYIARLLLNCAKAYPSALRQARKDAARAYESPNEEQIRLFPAGVPDNIPIELYPPVRQGDKAIELLLEAGADIWTENRQHYNAILWAVYYTDYFDGQI